MKLSVCFQKMIHSKKCVCLKFLAGKSFVFNIDLAVTEISAIGLKETCETDLYKSLVGACSLTTEAEMRMWTALCVAMYFFGASKASVEP